MREIFAENVKIGNYLVSLQEDLHNYFCDFILQVKRRSKSILYM